ncbi:ElaB protein [Hyphomicrobium sp. 1Nfss2.1]|uniref:DUF883 family protein n=1 Tax=unclassified Hyphomicrobium TaxID=2619925 RepID=UPI000930F6AD|nr:DUF883 family protein [Hyphomicrobium sp. NDB2Meth4]
MQFSSANRTGESNPGARQAASDVGDNVQALREDIASLAESVKRLASEQLGSSVEDLQDKAKEKVSDVEAAIRRNPSQAALIAAGIGFVFGLILSR